MYLYTLNKQYLDSQTISGIKYCCLIKESPWKSVKFKHHGYNRLATSLFPDNTKWIKLGGSNPPGHF